MLQSIGWGVRWLILPSPVHPYIHTYIDKERKSQKGYDKYNKNCKREQKDKIVMMKQLFKIKVE